MKKTLLSVLGVVLAFWLTTALYDWIKNRHSGTPQNYLFGGQVIDDATRSLLSGVQTKLVIGDTTTPDTTDSEGKFLFSIPTPGRQLTAVFVASATGYRDYTKNLGSDPSGVLEALPTVFLKANPQPRPPDPTAPVAPPPPKMTAKWMFADKIILREPSTAARIAASALKQ